MKSYTNYIAVVIACFIAFSLSAQTEVEDTTLVHELGKRKKIYLGADFDGAIFTTAQQSGSGNSNLATPRFTYFLGLGVNAHMDFNDLIGVYTGIGIKNIGFIEKVKSTHSLTGITSDSTIKRRVFTIGVPVGIKIGFLKERKFAIIGGGVDFPINYKEKGFIRRRDKDKFNESFSGRTARVMPYVFAGISIDPGIIFKVQYYPSNFMNPDYSTVNNNTVVTKPYAGYNVQLLMFSIGFDIHSKDKVKVKKEKEDAVGTM